MGTLKLLFSFVISLLSTIQMITSQDLSTTRSRCSYREPTVQFPFSLEGDELERRGGLPEFRLSCDEMNRTVLQLETWGNVLVRNINYTTQEVQIYDPNNCLLKRLLDISYRGSAFTDIYFENFGLIKLFKCSSELLSFGYSKPIRCLSTSNYTVYLEEINSRCTLWRSVIVPVPLPFYGFRYPLDGRDYIYLTWLAPNCGACVKQGGQCGFKNTESVEIECFIPPRRRLRARCFDEYVLGLGVGIPILTIVVLVACNICGRFKFDSSNNNINHLHHHRRHVELSSSELPAPAIYMVGLDEAVIHSYPTTVLGESRRFATPDDSNCSICLSEYQPKQTLRTIPECKHCFHAACIDEWLRRNVTCPLCRNSPLPEKSPV